MHFLKHLLDKRQNSIFDKYLIHRNYNARLNSNKKLLIITSKLVIYGSAASAKHANVIAKNIEKLWNKPRANVQINSIKYTVVFRINAFYFPGLTSNIVKKNTNQSIFFIRVEKEVAGLGVSLMDGVCSNTGFFLDTNVGYKGSTTEAHEYGHALGLWPGTADGHPQDLDQRGNGKPGIMYPRGTWVDAKYQWRPEVAAGEHGGTLMPDNRKVRQADVDMLQLHNRNWNNKGAIRLGALSNKFHEINFV